MEFATLDAKPVRCFAGNLHQYQTINVVEDGPVNLIIDSKREKKGYKKLERREARKWSKVEENIAAKQNEKGEPGGANPFPRFPRYEYKSQK